MASRVLIADDSSTVRSLMRGFLDEMTEIEICGEASDGLEAVEKAKYLKPDLVLLDLSMPQMNGAEVASVIKKTMPHVLIVLFTMYSDNVGKSLTSAIGVDLVLSKLDGMAQLVRSIRGLLQGPQNSFSQSA